MSGVREATHAGSWYTASSTGLAEQLNGNLYKVHSLPQLAYDPPVQNAKAVIAPHAGYSYSGPAAAWAYKAIPVGKIKRVILLGPSHHAYLPGVALSKFEAYETPLGDIPLDVEAIQDLRKTGIFSDMKSSVDEDEHSLEMHLPYIRLIFQNRDISLVPILVGHPSASTSQNLSTALEPFWSDPSTFFVISSDFCHWGSRFSCTPYYPDPPAIADPVPPTEPSKRPLAPGGKVDLIKKFSSAVAKPDVPIWRSIEYMDHEGMAILRNPAAQDAVDQWHDYLERTKNTICGRSPITVLLNLVQHVYADKADKPEFTFVRYEQSSRCVSGKDSSVSYVSGILRIPQ